MLKKLPFLTTLAMAGQLLAHPAPELAVRSHFDTETRTLTIRVEADPRVLLEGESDPEEVPFLKSYVIDVMTEEEKQAEIAAVEAFTNEAVALFFEPGPALKPEFSWSYGLFGDGDEEITLYSDLVLHGEWKVAVPEDVTGFYIAPRSGLLVSVRYENLVDGKKLERYQMLFGGEKSYLFNFKAPE